MIKKYKVSVATTYWIDEEDECEDENDALNVAEQMLEDDIEGLAKGNIRIKDIFSFDVEEDVKNAK